MRDQAEQLRKLASRGRAGAGTGLGDGGGRVIAVTSGKGGVGKSNVVANLGVLLARKGKRVTIIDADFGLANLDILFNLNQPKNLGHLLKGTAEPREVVGELSPGLRIIPGGSGIDALADLDVGERERLLAALAPLTRDQDFVLLDTAAGAGRNVVDLCLAAGEVVLVTNPEPTSLTDAYGLLKILRGREPDVRIRLLVNSVADAREADAVHQKLQEVVRRFLGGDLEYLGGLLRDPCVNRATARQTPFVTAYPRGPASRSLAAIAEVLLGTQPPERGGSQGFWQRLLAVGG